MRTMFTSLMMLLWMTFLLGVVYPFLVTGISHLTMSDRANGSIIRNEQAKPIGSLLIAQAFASDRYFWPRPSAINYQPRISGGSNLGPTSSMLKDLVHQRLTKLSKAHEEIAFSLIPSELVYSSASGLDPHISPATAKFQVERIAKARNLSPKSKEALNQLIVKKTRPKYLTVFGQPYVNVLELNQLLENGTYE